MTWQRPRHVTDLCRICLRAVALDHERNRVARLRGMRRVALASGLV